MKFHKLFVLMLTLIVASTSLAQTSPTTTAGGGTSSQKKTGPRKQAAVIIFSGLGGAILGLSTLSFYGRPQDKLSNIAVGAALGIIVGTVYVTYKAATAPQDFYGPDYNNGNGQSGYLQSPNPINPTKLSYQPPAFVVNYNWKF